MYQQFIKMALAALISACMSQAILAVDRPPNDNPPEKTATELTTSASKSTPAQKNLSVSSPSSSSFSPIEGEPLLLLLLGLAVFVGATTIKRKRSSMRSDGNAKW